MTYVQTMANLANEHEALVALSKMTMSRTRAILLGLAIMLVMFGMGAVAYGHVILGPLGIAVVVGIVIKWVLRIKTSPSSIPTLRCMRDRPEHVAAIVGIERGAYFLAVTGADGKLLAQPMRITTAAELAAGLSRMAAATRNDVNGTAVANAPETIRDALNLAGTVCPQANTAFVQDHMGIASLGRLARKASAASRQAHTARA